MKDQKGVTITSLVIYLIGITIVIATIATITTYFYRNTDEKSTKIQTTTQFTKLSSHFVSETKKDNNVVLDSKTEGTLQEGNKVSYIVFSSGNQYTFMNNAIYKNKIKICDNIDDCDFSYMYEDFKYKITVNFKTADMDLTGENAIVYYL